MRSRLKLSGIFSDTFADDRFGVALSASYQKRDLGFNQAAVRERLARVRAATRTTGARFRSPARPAPQNITNRPDAGGHVFGAAEPRLQRERHRAQAHQRPADVAVRAHRCASSATLDYTYSENKVATQRNELSVWFNFGPSVEHVDAMVRSPAPLIYSETIPAANSDLSMGGAKFATKNENNSLGFNLAWKPLDKLGLEFDFHDSDAESGRGQPVWLERRAGRRGLLPRHHHSRFLE